MKRKRVKFKYDQYGRHERYVIDIILY